MKKILAFTFLLSLVCFYAFSQTPITLDEAIRNSAREMGRTLPRGTRLALLNFNCDSIDLSEYVLDELHYVLTNDRALTSLDRRDIDALQQQLNFQVYGEVSDELLQYIGRMLGAQMMVSGSWGILGSDYRIRLQVLEVETGRIRYSRSQTVKNTYEVHTLLFGSGIERDFTTGQRVGASALNLVLGMGSFIIQKDIKSGISTLLIEVLGAGIIGGGIYYKSFTRNYYTGDKWDKEGYDFEMSLAGALTGIGVGVYSFGVIFGGIRTFLYHKPGAFIGMETPNPFNIAVVPDYRGNAALQLSYSLSF